MSILLVVLIVLIVVALFGGIQGHALGWSPLGVLLLVLLILLLTGNLGHLRL
jgi:FtsH-binding integral membrane protein